MDTAVLMAHAELVLVQNFGELGSAIASFMAQFALFHLPTGGAYKCRFLKKALKNMVLE